MKEKNMSSRRSLSAALFGSHFLVFLLGILSGLTGIYALWRILAGDDPAALRQIAGTLIAVSAVFGAASLAFALFFWFRFSGAVAKPLSRLADAARRFSAGELDVRTGIRSDGELGEISSSLDRSFALLNQDVSEISETLDRISRGDLSGAVEHEYRGDFARITQSFRAIQDRLNRTFTVIRATSDQVGSGAEQVSNAAQQLAQGATEQAASVEELSSSVEEISDGIRQTSEHIGRVTSYMEETTRDVEKSNGEMQRMLASMEEVNASTGEIRKIIKVIDDIAFQTNILALNAAVEAARAGEAGKGFAVVAEEVRALASKSAAAAKQTTDLIERSIARIADSAGVADSTAKALRDVAARIVKVNESVENINSASATQSEAARQVTQGIEQISTVVQTNSATAEESAAASEELSSQAVQLRQELGQFRLRGGGKAPVGRPAAPAAGAALPEARERRAAEA